MFRKSPTPIIQLNRKTAFYSALSLSLFLVFVQIIILIYSYYMGENVGERFYERLAESKYDIRPVNLFFEPLILFLGNTFLVYLYFLIEFWILRHFSNNRKKIWLSLFAMLVFVGILSTAISQLLGIWFKGSLTAYHYSIIQFVKDLLLFITSVFVTNLLSLIIKNQERIEENKNLAIENIKNRYNALKNQTDPHFLFNSLNSLNGLIGYDDERAHEYLMQLSSVFRYTIQERSVVALSEEMEFSESYIYLMKIRYGDAFSANIQILDGHQTYYILPFAIQTLVENAVKHNVVSLQKPLKLNIIETGKETVIVENNLQPRLDVRDGNGLGLSNLNERYWLMYRKNVNIQADDAVFRVEIPLIKKEEV